MLPVLFKLGPLTVNSYGVMVALGFLSGILLAIYLAKKEKIAPEMMMDLALFVMISSIIGARIFYVIEFWPEYWYRPLAMLFVWEGGLVFYGGLLGAVLTVLVFSRFNKLPVLKLLDLITPATALGYAIGRIGCFLRGCCYGVECKLPWAVKFPEAAGLRHPTQLYSLLTWLILFGVLWFLLTKRKFDGQIFALGLILYSVYRFLIEFVRTNPQYFHLTAAQWGSLLLLIGAGVLYFKLSKAGSSDQRQ